MSAASWLLEKHQLRKMRADIGFVFQQFNLSRTTLPGKRNLGPQGRQEIPEEEAREIGLRALADVGLSDKVDSYQSAVGRAEAARRHRPQYCHETEDDSL